jgi:hypothetical protein
MNRSFMVKKASFISKLIQNSDLKREEKRLRLQGLNKKRQFWINKIKPVACLAISSGQEGGRGLFFALRTI